MSEALVRVIKFLGTEIAYGILLTEVFCEFDPYAPAVEMSEVYLLIFCKASLGMIIGLKDVPSILLET